MQLKRIILILFNCINYIFAIHEGKNEIPEKCNPHAHVIITDRPVCVTGFEAKKDRRWNRVQLLCKWRERWAEMHFGHPVPFRLVLPDIMPFCFLGVQGGLGESARAVRFQEFRDYIPSFFDYEKASGATRLRQGQGIRSPPAA